MQFHPIVEVRFIEYYEMHANSFPMESYVFFGVSVCVQFQDLSRQAEFRFDYEYFVLNLRVFASVLAYAPWQYSNISLGPQASKPAQTCRQDLEICNCIFLLVHLCVMFKYGLTH